MITKRIGTVCGRALAAAAALALVASSVPCALPAAHAETTDELSQQVEQAQERLGELTHQLESAQAELDETRYQLEDTRSRISQLEEDIASNEEKLSEARDELSSHISSSYKAGGLSLIDFLLSADSFGELTSRVYYADKLADAESRRIADVNDLQDELASQRDELGRREEELSTLAEEQEASQQELQAATTDANDYLNGLSSELQAALEAERAAAAEESRRQAEQAQQQQQQQQQNQNQQSQNHGQQNQGQQTAPSAPSSGGGSGSLSAAQRQTIVNAAMSQIGVDYSLGAYQPGVLLDCSGLTTYAYAQAGISIRHQSGAQYRTVVNAGNLKTSTSALEVGDLVFYGNPNISHVAIYIGGGQIVHANGYGRGVMVSSVNYSRNFRGGGSPV